MGASGGLMAASYGTQSAAALGGAYAQSQAQGAMGNYERTVGRVNAGYAGLSAQDALSRGDINANRKLQQTRSVQSSQRASLAAQGVDVNSGSASDVQAGTRVMGELDALTIKNNAWKEAWGFKVQAANAEAEGDMKGRAADSAARQTLLTGGMNALSYGMKAGGSLSRGGNPGLSDPFAAFNPRWSGSSADSFTDMSDLT